MLPEDLNNPPTLSVFFEDNNLLERLTRSLSAFLENQRWFAAKTEGIQSVEILDSVEIPDGRTKFELVLATVVTKGGATDCYALPVAWELANDASSCHVIMNPSDNSAATQSRGSIVESSGDSEFWRAMTTTLANQSLTSRNGRVLKLTRTGNSRLGTGDTIKKSAFTIHGGEQSNSAVAIGGEHFLKLFRRPRVGHNPDAEIGIFLTDQTEFRNSPLVEATIEISGADGNRCLALISEQVQGDTDAWSYTLDNLKDFWERLAGLDDRPEFPPAMPGDALIGCDEDVALAKLDGLIGGYRQDVEQLGRRTAELHAALSSCDIDPVFAPEPLTQESLNQLTVTIKNEVRSTCELMEKSNFSASWDALFPQKVSQRANDLLDEMLSLDVSHANVVNIRCHGDYHLGQVLRTESDFIIIDFEGEPDRPFDERRLKRCAMKDVAGMIRSLHYASCAAAVGMLPAPKPSIVNPGHWQTYWFESVKSEFLAGYRQAAAGKRFIPEDATVTQKLLDLFLIEKVLYELRYEINNRPDWVQIPLAGLNAVLGL